MPLSNLNFEQLQSARAPMGYNLTIASAGTGKTSTIVGRIAYLFSQGISPEEILLLTFTNKAAAEMVARVAKSFGERMAKGIQAGTFHSIAYKYLQKYNITLKQPRELKVLFKSIAEKRIYMDRDGSAPYSAQYLYDIYSLYLNAQKNQSFGEWLIERSPEQEKYVLIYEGIFDEFSALKKSHHYADFNDLLLYFKEDVIKYPQNYAEILCDEYQDTNPLQDSKIPILCKIPSLMHLVPKVYFAWGIMIRVSMLLMARILKLLLILQINIPMPKCLHYQKIIAHQVIS